jgi:hypothetical protein
MNAFWAYVKANWKTNLAAVAAFAVSVPQFVTAVEAWQAGQPANWRGAVISLIVAAGLAVAKDGDNHSTIAQVQASTAAQVASKPVTAETP